MKPNDSILLNPEDVRSEQIAAVREIVRQIKSLPGHAKTPAALGHLADILVAEVTGSGWGHTDDAVSASEYLADAATVLGEMDRDSHIGLDDDPIAAMRRAGM